MKHTIALLFVVLFVAGCGGDGSRPGDHHVNPAPAGNDIGDGHKGGHATFVAGRDVDYLDPGLTYDPLGFMVAYATNRPLYSYAPDHPTKPVDDLADGPPEVSANHRTVTVHIKPGIKYAPPVGGVVRAQDVRYAIERAFTTSVPSGYASTYFGDIEGAPPKAIAMKRLQPFSGLQTPDDTTLVIKLTRPVAERLVAALALPITAPVPEAYAAPMDAHVPSTYDSAVAFTGPYMVRDRVPGKRLDLVRNPNWSADDDYRPAFLDSIRLTETTPDPAVAARRTLAGKHLLCCDTAQPSAAVVRAAADNHPAQLGTVPSGGTRWVALNTSKPPFDNVDVRRAVVAGVDRDALRATLGGAEAGPVAQSFLPPGIPGFAESGGLQGFSSDLDYLSHPGGNVAVFKKYMLRAARAGVPVDPKTGRYTGRQPVTIVGDNADPGLATGRAVSAALRKLGFRTVFRKVPRDTVATKYCGVPSATPDVCPSVGWFKDLTDPQSMLEPTFDGDAIKPRANVNYSLLDDADIDRAMGAAALLSGPDRNDAWAAINRRIADQAPAIPYLWDDAFGLQSADMGAVMNGYLTTWDLSFSSVK